MQATRNLHWLRETLAIEYFFSPDCQPFKMSPRLYRAAVAADISLEFPMVDKRGCYLPVLYALFDIEPFALPRTDPTLRCWARQARSRLLEYRTSILKSKDLIEIKTKRGKLRVVDHHKFRALKLDLIYC